MKIKKSKPLKDIKKGDSIKVDGKAYEVDAHGVMIDHGTAKEMVIEIFDPKKEDSDFQIRYFDHLGEESIKFYEFNGLMYGEKEVKSIEW